MGGQRKTQHIISKPVLSSSSSPSSFPLPPPPPSLSYYDYFAAGPRGFLSVLSYFISNNQEDDDTHKHAHTQREGQRKNVMFSLPNGKEIAASKFP